MNREFELKLQAYLDGELGAREARELEQRLTADATAQALLAELRLTAGALRGNEPERQVPETREFYWSKIERGIEAAAKADRPAGAWGLGWLFRYWPQMSGASVALVLLFAATAHFHLLTKSGWDDIENPLSETGTFCFRSEPDRMTLVWVYDRVEEPEEGAETVD
jgi:anti-sigma factor RsiW